MKILLSDQAISFLRSLKNKKLLLKVREALNDLQSGKTSPQIKKLSGVQNGYRKRVGRYRILYTLHSAEGVLRIWIIDLEKDTQKDYRRWISYILERL